MKPEEEIRITFRDQALILSALKAIYWVENESLILSDLHLAKAGHFRKSGIAIPGPVNDGNLSRLDTLITRYSPKRILFLGDLFHSTKNTEWNIFKSWRSTYPEIEMHLAVGNHDFHAPEEYESLGLICSESIEADPFILLHDKSTNDDTSSLFPISGHVHPSVKMVGKGRQAKRVPCFFLGEFGLLLPAFGNFTGTHTIKPGVDDVVFGIIENQIMQLS